MDLIIVLVCVLAIAIIYKKKAFRKIILFFGIIEVFFRVIAFINSHVEIGEFNKTINKYVPSSLFSMVGKYTSGVVYEILIWILVIIFIILEYYLVKYFFKKGK